MKATTWTIAGPVWWSLEFNIPTLQGECTFRIFSTARVDDNFLLSCAERWRWECCENGTPIRSRYFVRWLREALKELGVPGEILTESEFNKQPPYCK